MASQLQPHSNLLAFHTINLNSDGSLTRPVVHTSPPTPQLTTDSQLTLSKDIPLNPSSATFLRLYRPVTPPPEQKLPIIIYFHGGGFVMGSTTETIMHVMCTEISAQSRALVVSVEYRLAPECRLPAAYEDGVEAVMWVRDQGLRSKVDGGGCDEWLAEMADFSKVYLMGGSAGGNLAYHTGLRVLDRDRNLEGITIVGFIFDQPFFGGVERTPSELRLVNDCILPLEFVDFMWSLALPLGSDKDHAYCNPFGDQHRSSNGNKNIKRLPKCLIRGHDGDPMVDRQKEFGNMLEAHGVHVTRRFYDNGCHVVEIFDPDKAQIFYDDVKSFVQSSSLMLES